MQMAPKSTLMRNLAKLSTIQFRLWTPILMGMYRFRSLWKRKKTWKTRNKPTKMAMKWIKCINWSSAHCDLYFHDDNKHVDKESPIMRKILSKPLWCAPLLPHTQIRTRTRPIPLSYRVTFIFNLFSTFLLYKIAKLKYKWYTTYSKFDSCFFFLPLNNTQPVKTTVITT